MRHTAHAKQRGSILVTILMITFFLTSVLFGLLLLANANLYRARGRIMMLQAQYSAESGADAAITILNRGNTSFAGDATEVRRQAHKLKGSCGSAGAKELAALGARAERLAQDEDWGALRGSVGELRHALDRVKGAITVAT